MDNGVGSVAPPPYSLEDPAPLQGATEPSQPTTWLPVPHIETPSSLESDRAHPQTDRFSATLSSSPPSFSLRPDPSAHGLGRPLSEWTSTRSARPSAIPSNRPQSSPPSLRPASSNRTRPYVQPVLKRPNTVNFVLSRSGSVDFLLRDASENIMYWIQRDAARLNIIRIFKPGLSGEKTPVAEVEFRSPRESIVVLNYEQHRLDALFRPKSWPSASRLVSTPHGDWKWGQIGRNPILWDEKRVVMLRSIFGPEHDGVWSYTTLQVHYKVLDQLDMVVLGLVVKSEEILKGHRRI